MIIALIIVGGLVLITAVAAGFDYLGKRGRAPGREEASRFESLEVRVKNLEAKSLDKDERIARLESDLAFMNRLLEDGGGGKDVPGK